MRRGPVARAVQQFRPGGRESVFPTKSHGGSRSDVSRAPPHDREHFACRTDAWNAANQFVVFRSARFSSGQFTNARVAAAVVPISRFRSPIDLPMKIRTEIIFSFFVRIYYIECVDRPVNNFIVILLNNARAVFQ